MENEVTDINGKNLSQAPAPQARAYCDTCSYSQLILAGNEPKTICREKGPTIVGGAIVVNDRGTQIAQIVSQTMWPVVNREDWCPRHTPDPRGVRTVLPANDDAKSQAESPVIAAP
jgi:hypothetical protein